MDLFDNTTLSGKTLKNRIFRSATNEHVSYADGRISEELLDIYEELARGGVGTIITGHYAVLEGSRASIGQALLPIQDDARLQEAADRVHAHGALLVMQMSHGGLKASQEVNGCPSRGPGELSREELAEIRHAFVEGARRVQRAGFDGVQVHLAHGYLLSSFLDPYQNTRTDEYGSGVDPETASPEELLAGTEGRFRLTGEILREIRSACGEDFLLLVKVNADATRPIDYVPFLHRVLELCQEAGASAVEISGLSFSTQRPDRDEPYYLKEVQAAADGITMPQILVGGLDSRTKMQQVLDAGIPYVSLCRSLICQPDFVNRLQEGAESSPCLRCFGCFRVHRTKHVRCVLHTQPISILDRG